jgi:hypothetical protein
MKHKSDENAKVVVNVKSGRRSSYAHMRVGITFDSNFAECY